ncbi:hypothetical protein [Nocardia sp. NPDC046763]|uniref:hypothetical protein n=1 Tax=Nocardia sp. NPDC046763 TaxID=3155256 RepID=UPI0033DBC37D
MITNNAKKILATSLLTIGLAAGVTVAAPLAMAEHGCHSNDHDSHGGNNGDRGSHGSFLMPNGAATPLGCIPGSMTRPCESGVH